jgi:hypothetical protein
MSTLIGQICRWPQSDWLALIALACFSVFVSVDAAGARDDPCSSDLDCQLNGACTSGACVCDKGWRGVDCGTLNLNNTANVAYGYTPESKFSSWGGGPPMWDSATGKYQLLA